MSGHDEHRVGVLVMAHGTPDHQEAIKPFYTRIRRGSPPSDEQLAELVGRYDAIGGTSPLAARTRAQVDAIASLLHHDAPGRYVVRFGAKHTDPSIEAAVGELIAARVDTVIGLVLTPHRSSMGSDQYLDRAATALATALATDSDAIAPIRFVPVHQWFDEPGFVDLLADRVVETAGALDPTEHRHTVPAGRTVVLFTAHSLPQRVVAAGDRYPDQLAESAARIADMAEIDDWQIAWQSAGRTPEPWIGPDLLDVIRLLAGQGSEAVVVCPVGFVSDHLEILYDLDIEARAVAESVGLRFARTPSLNDDPRFVRVLADVIERAAAIDHRGTDGFPGTGSLPGTDRLPGTDGFPGTDRLPSTGAPED